MQIASITKRVKRTESTQQTLNNNFKSKSISKSNLLSISQIVMQVRDHKRRIKRQRETERERQKQKQIWKNNHTEAER